MRHHGKERVMVMMVMIAELLTLLRFEMVLGQQQPCSTSDNGTPQGCCPCQTGSSDDVGAWLLCERTCPPRYYVNNDTSACALPSTPPASTTTNTTEQEGGNSTSETTTLSNDSTTDPNITPTPTTSATPTPLLLLCISCHVTCQSCNGSDAEDCQACANEHEFQTTNGAKTCVRIQKEESPRPNVGVIVGAVVGGVVLIVVVVVALVVCRRRRRQNMEPKHTRSISTLMGSGVATTIVNNDEDVEWEERETTPSGKVSSVKVTYGNIQSSTLNPEAIQQGHDKVFRYTRDPTVKANTKVTTTATEEKELQDLPVAPTPPRQTPTVRPPQDQYEIVESPAAKSEPKPNPSPQTQPPNPAPAYEIMEMPKNSASRRKTSGPHPTRSQTTLLKPGETKRKMAGVASTLPTPYPASPVSCPELPRFPKEQEEQSRSGRQQAAKSHHRVPPPPPTHEEPDTLDPDDDYVNVGEKPKNNAQDQESAASDPEDNYENSGASKMLFAQLKAGKKAQKEEQTTASDPEDDYENSGASKKLFAQLKARKNAQKEEQAEASDPEDDYENYGAKRKLVPGNNRDQSQGLVNPAADLLEEPEKIYGNQEAFEEQEPQPRYSNTSFPPQENVESSKKSSGGADDQDSDDDHAYQNVPSPRSKP